MGYILAEIVACLMLAGLIGGIIGWLLRGKDKHSLEENKKLKEALQEKDAKCQEELKTLRSDYEEKLKSQKDFWVRKHRLLEEQEISTKPELEKTSEEKISRTEEPEASLEEVEIKEHDHKQTLLSASTISSNKDAECYELEEVQGIGPGFALRLKKRGVFNSCYLAEKFLRDDKATKKISQKLDIDFDTIRSWASMADLMRVKGISGEFSEVLYAIGVENRADLRKADAYHLYAQLKEYYDKYPNSNNLEIPSVDEIKDWIASLQA